MMIKRAMLYVCLGLFLSSCAGMKKQDDIMGGPTQVTEPAAVIPPDVKPETEQSAIDAKKYGEISYQHNRYVDTWIEYFQGRGRRYMEVYLERSTRYFPLMKGVLRQNGLPEDLIYVPLIESGFSPKAVSSASAVGYWQFIRGTGKRYGLRIDNMVDERRDPLLATQAAAEYFKELYRLTGDWYLSLASYNTGENRVLRAMRKTKSTDFFQIIQTRRAIPRETVNYVPKFLAARIIYKNPTAYGFHQINFQKPLEYDVVEVKEPISLIKLGEALNVSFEDMQSLNPRYRSDYVPVYDGEPTRIRVPTNMMSAAYAALPQAKAEAPTWVAQEFFFYKVRNGDTLSTIARRHGTRIAILLDLNNLNRRTMIRVGQKLKVPETAPRLTPRGGTRRQKSEARSSSPRGLAGKSTGRVAQASSRRGTHIGGLSAIAKTQAGKMAKLPAKASKAKVASVKKTQTHKVRAGENLTTIAQKYGVSVNQLRKLNKIKPSSVLKSGTKLRVADSK